MNLNTQALEDEKSFYLYEKQILQCFKKVFFKTLNQEKEFEFENILLLTLQELGLEEYSKFDFCFLRSWFDNIYKMAFLTNFTCGDNLNEILVHGHNFLQCDQMGEMKSVNIDGLAPEDYQHALEVLCHRNNIAWNYSNPFESFTTTINGDLFRATLVHNSITPSRESKLFLRKPAQACFSLGHYGLPNNLFSFFETALKEKKNMIITGSTGSGKTSFLNTLVQTIPISEHLVILEDVHEIRSSHPSRTNLLAAQEKSKKGLKEYCAYALRMRPDRIIVGEMRSNEIVPFILAMNTGHKGLMSTLHANSAKDAISRLGLLFSLYSENKDISYELVLKLICQNVDYIVHLNQKRVCEVVSILGCDGTTPFFEYIYNQKEMFI